MTVSVPAYAKINLFLDISSRRENGYHNIVSYMHSVSLCDTVTVSFTSSDVKTISVTCSNSELPVNEDNLVYKAAKLHPICGEIKIHIEKRIPISAGLAGGSADAAATMKALDMLSDAPLGTDELCRIGATLGADIPFCIKGGACIAEGIGEILNETQFMPNYPIVIAKKGDGMSTPAAYRELDQKFENFVGYSVNNEYLSALINSFGKDIDQYCDNLFNIFETVVEPQRPFVTEIKGIMKKQNAAGSMMSGSGTSVFGIFKNEADAEAAVSALKDIGAEAHLCYPLL